MEGAVWKDFGSFSARDGQYARWVRLLLDEGLEEKKAKSHGVCRKMCLRALGHSHRRLVMLNLAAAWRIPRHQSDSARIRKGLFLGISSVATQLPSRNAPMTGLKAPRRRGDAVLYLDFDGVLHHEAVFWAPKRGPYVKAPGFSLFQHAQLLEDVLEPYPGLKIVLSTSWVRLYSCSKAAKRLPPNLRAKVIGCTFHSEMIAESFAALPRGVQIAADVQRRQPCDWLAVDDDDADWPAQYRDKLVHTHEELGISEPAVFAELQLKLALMHGAR